MKEIIIEKSMIERMLTDSLQKFEKVLPILAGKLLFLLILVFIWPKLVNFILFSMKKFSERRQVDPLFSSFLRSLIKTILYIVLFFFVISTLGVQTTSLVTILGTAGIAVGLALQGSLANLASGMILLFFKNVSKGDFISANNGAIEGVIKSIHILYTTITTPDGLALIVPNSQLANSAIINFTKNPERRLDLVYSTSYDNSVEKTLKILQQVVDEEKRIVQNEERTVVISLIKHNSSSLDYRFRVWVKIEDYFDVMYDINKRVKELFDENEIEIPYNKLDIYNRK
ncbi:MAG: mechanosensitive ion channel [Fusobacterium sp.]|uniref:mechanosensitive ion channel family protein n=1 Tax=Fusobacterium sp. TaxID=68766 RepID=UPI0026DBEBE9|nr:mechanosensitive ion channel domain-containing protein [Fusobacterium sp.]MDO4690109.1 mechanosensitive ion channel [Fusobacterium sp.]